MQEYRVTAGRPNAIRDLVSLIIQHVSQRDVGTFSGEAPRGRGTHAGCRTGNDCYLARQTCRHSLLPRRW
jgi:hypothetical protein